MDPRDLRLRKSLETSFPSGWLERVGIAAVSGGADSMAMLELLADVGRPVGKPIIVAYVDHRLRPEAAFETTWVHAAATRRGLAFRRLSIASSDTSENSLRTHRYAALTELASEVGARWIATAHTADDQIETVLFRLVRGAGRHGLAGIPPLRDAIIRPLLSIRRSDLRALLERRGVGWCEDRSNDDGRHARNRLRHEVLPAIERAFGRDCLRHLPAWAERWREEDHFLASEAQRYQAFAFQRVDGGPALDLKALDLTPAAIRTLVLRGWFEAVSGGRVATSRQVAVLERLASSHHGSVSVRMGGLWVTREYGRLLAREKAQREAGSFAIPVDLSKAVRLEGPSGVWWITIRPGLREQAIRTRAVCYEEIDLNPHRLVGPLELRSLRDGDAVCVGGRRGHRTIRDIMSDRKVPQRARQDWPVLASGHRIVWVPGLAIEAGIQSNASSASVRVVWRRERI